jgi:mannose-6-phosphate isomerase-like protein (cupin superfamily)
MEILRFDELSHSNNSIEFEGEGHGAGVSFFIVDAAPGRGPSLHKHDYAEVFIVQQGEATVVAGEEERVVRAGDVVIVPPGLPHAFTNTGDGPLRQIDIHLSGRFATEWLEGG